MAKWMLGFAFVLLTLIGNAQWVRISKGTVLVYSVEQYGNQYTYEVTVAEEEPFDLTWKAGKQTVYKGECQHVDSVFYYGARLLVKPNQAPLEEPDDVTIRLAVPLDLCTAIDDTLSPVLYCGLDNVDVALEKYSSYPKVRSVLYNQKLTSFESRQYRDKNMGIQVAFMPYGHKRYWVYSYKDENMTMQLQSVGMRAVENTQEENDTLLQQ